MSNKQPLTADRPTRRKLTPEQEREVLDLSAKGIRQEVLAVQFGVHFNTIGNVLRRAKSGGSADTETPSVATASDVPAEEHQEATTHHAA